MEVWLGTLIHKNESIEKAIHLYTYVSKADRWLDTDIWRYS